MAICKIAIVFILIFTNFIGNSQNISGRILKKKGSRVQFNLKTVKQIQNGVTYEELIELEIQFCDSNHTTTGWELRIRSLESEFTPAFGSNPIPLNKLKITSKVGATLTLELEDEPMSSGYPGLLIADGPPPINTETCVNETISLSFTCVGLSGYDLDFYDLNLDIELKSK